MAQSVFDATFDTNNRIDVNSFDWSHVNNLTTNFGRITPVFCELVPAKGSVRINPEFGLELMPMVFPVQTRMFARLNFFKVTLRSMWEDYSDFIFIIFSFDTFLSCFFLSRKACLLAKTS